MVLDPVWDLFPNTLIGYGGLLIALPIIYVCAVSMYNLYFHPLSSYPGPFWARAGRLWYINSLLHGDLPFDVHAMHVKYGPVIRIAPDELAYIDADAWKDIYGHRVGKGEVPKDPQFYENASGGALSIIFAQGEFHGQVRRLLSHGFSERALRDQEPIIQSYIDLLIRRLRDLSVKQESIDIVQWYNFFTFDIIGDLAFGESFGCLETSNYHPWIDILFELIRGGSFNRSAKYYPIFQRMLVAVIPKKLKENYQAHKDLMKSKALHRLNMKTDRLDFMTRMADPNSGLSVEQFVASSDTVLLGGSETTSTLLSGVTYYLVQHPKTLEKLVQEIRLKFTSEDQIDLPGVNSLDYMLACLQETFRLYPPVPGALPRRTREGDIFAGKYVPPNTTVAIYQWAMYRSSKHFSRTLEYIPERWMGDPEFANDNRSVLQPFSVGARNCIGRNLAYVEMRLVLARLLFNFDIEATPAVQGWTNQKVHLLWMKPPLMIKLRPRDVQLRPQVIALAETDASKTEEAKGTIY